MGSVFPKDFCVLSEDILFNDEDWMSDEFFDAFYIMPPNLRKY